MHAVVLVGGFGTRLRPLTNTVPKAMLPIAHVPLLVRLIGQLERGGVDHVDAGPRASCPSRSSPRSPTAAAAASALDYAIEPEPLDTAGAIRFAADHAGIDDTFVVANGDVLTDLSIADLVAAHRAADAEATIHLIGVDDPSAFGVVERDADGRDRCASSRSRRPAPSRATSSTPAPTCSSRACSTASRSGERSSIERDTFPAVAADGRFYSLATDDYWIDAGRPELYRQANLDLVNGRRAERVRRRSPRAPRSPPTPRVARQRRRRRRDGRCRRHGRPARSSCPGARDRRRRRRRGLDRRRRRRCRSAVVVRTVVGADAKIADGEHLRDARVPEPVD